MLVDQMSASSLQSASLSMTGRSAARFSELQIPRSVFFPRKAARRSPAKLVVKAVTDPIPTSKATRLEHKALVQQTWKLLKKDAQKHGLDFFLKVFEIAPTTIQMFSFLRDSDVPLEKNQQLKAHALSVFSMTCEAAIALGDDPNLTALKPKLLELGQSHAIHKVRDEHFDVVGYALMETLKDALKDGWSPEVKAAWAHAYDAITKVIKDEMHRAEGDPLSFQDGPQD